MGDYKSRHASNLSVNVHCHLTPKSLCEKITWALALAATPNSIESPLLASLFQWLGNVS